MKYLSKIILVLIIVVPIILCVTTLNKLWSDDEELQSGINNGDTNNKISGDQIIIEDYIPEDTNKISGEMGGEQYVSTIGSPISKIYTDAKVAISVANVYTESRETSDIVGTLEKYTIVTAQKYPEGWSRITNDTISGWMRTENITFPEGGNLDTNGKVKTGKIKAEPYLNMRASANSSAQIITTIPNGTEVTIKEEVTGWYKVTYASATGWVSAAYVVINP